MHGYRYRRCRQLDKMTSTAVIGVGMDAERAQNAQDPNDLFINTPEGAFGPSGYSEMNLMRWINDKVASLFRRLRARHRD